MSGRFQRGKTAGISPFFAFQDIITSAMAVVITIVMLLALDMGDPTQGSTVQSATAELDQQLSKLLDQLAQAKISLDSAQHRKDVASLDSEILKGEILVLRRDLQDLPLRAGMDINPSNDATSAEASKSFQIEIENLTASNATRAQLIPKLKTDIASRTASMNLADKELDAKQAQLLAEQAQKNELKLIPERSNTSKEPVLVIVSASQLTLQRIDNPDKTVMSGSGLISQFEASLKKFSTINHHFVFYFKPSGVDFYSAITSMVKDQGFEIGYDAILEDVNITFTSSK